jgi:hypothetical protein
MKQIFSICRIAIFLQIWILGDEVMAVSTGNVRVTGNVPIICDIQVQEEANASNIADISTGHTERHIATVTENCNSPSGYTVTVSAANTGAHTGKFVDTLSQDAHPFTITYNGVTVSPGGVITDSSSLVFGSQKNVTITYPKDATLTGTVDATYEETLTFTISAK